MTLGTIGMLGAKQLFGQQVVRALGIKQDSKPILSVGYWDGLIRGEGAETPTTHVLNAKDGGIDGRFRRGAAMVTTYGYWRAPQNRAIPVSLALVAFYPEIDPATGQKIPFVAWNVVVRGERVDGTLRSRFVVPVDNENRIELAVEKHVPVFGTGPDLDQTRALLTDRSSVIDLGQGVALQRGFYFIALRDNDSQDLPDWGRVRVGELRSADRVEPDGESILTGPAGNPVGFDYIVLKVEPYGVTTPADRPSTDHSH